MQIPKEEIIKAILSANRDGLRGKQVHVVSITQDTDAKHSKACNIQLIHYSNLSATATSI